MDDLPITQYNPSGPSQTEDDPGPPTHIETQKSIQKDREIMQAVRKRISRQPQDIHHNKRFRDINTNNLAYTLTDSQIVTGRDTGYRGTQIEHYSMHNSKEKQKISASDRDQIRPEMGAAINHIIGLASTDNNNQSNQNIMSRSIESHLTKSSLMTDSTSSGSHSSSINRKILQKNKPLGYIEQLEEMGDKTSIRATFRKSGSSKSSISKKNKQLLLKANPHEKYDMPENYLVDNGEDQINHKHSGNFMRSYNNDRVPKNYKEILKKGRVNRFSLFEINNVKRLTYYMHEAFLGGTVVNPKWKNFTGLKLRMFDRVRLNNFIWRTWYGFGG